MTDDRFELTIERFINAPPARKHEDLGFQEGWGTAIDQLTKIVQRP